MKYLNYLMKPLNYYRSVWTLKAVFFTNFIIHLKKYLNNLSVKSLQKQLKLRETIETYVTFEEAVETFEKTCDKIIEIFKVQKSI